MGTNTVSLATQLILLSSAYFHLLLDWWKALGKIGKKYLWINTSLNHLADMDLCSVAVFWVLAISSVHHCFLLFRSWFGDTMNRGHLKRYFLFLEILNTIFFCIYLLVLSNYAHMEVINPSRRMWNYKLLKTHLNSTLNVPNRLVWV